MGRKKESGGARGHKEQVTTASPPTVLFTGYGLHQTRRILNTRHNFFQHIQQGPRMERVSLCPTWGFAAQFCSQFIHPVRL
jgi:hypothetical protein